MRISASFPNQAVSPPPPELPLTVPRDESNCDQCDTCSGGGVGRGLCESARAGWEVETAPIRGLCEAKKKVVNFWAGTNIGTVEFSGVQAEAKLAETPLTLSINQDLSQATLDSRINLETKLSGRATLK